MARSQDRTMEAWGQLDHLCEFLGWSCHRDPGGWWRLHDADGLVTRVKGVAEALLFAETAIARRIAEVEEQRRSLRTQEVAAAIAEGNRRALERLQGQMPAFEFEGPIGYFWLLDEVPIEAITDALVMLADQAERRGYSVEAVLQMGQRRLVEALTPRPEEG